MQPDGRLRADRGRRAAGVALPRRRRAARARPARRPHHRGARLRRRARGDLGRRRARRRRDRLGWDVVLVGPGPGIIGSDSEFGHGGMAALDSAHAALALGLPTLLSPRLSSSDPRERHVGLSHHTPHGARAAARAGRGRRPGGRARRSSPHPRGGGPAATAVRSGRGRPRRLRGLRPAGAGRWAARCARTRSSSPRRSPRAPPCAARDEAGPGEPARHGDRGQATGATRAGGPGGGQALRGPRPRLPLLPGAGARPLAQHPERLPHRPAPVRGVPRRPRSRRAHGAAGRHRRVPRRPRHRQRPPGLLGGDDPPQGRLPALLLQTPAPRRADRRRPDRGADRAAPREEAAPGPQLRRGPEAARRAARRRADRAARPRPARGDVRLRAARLGDDRARARRHRPAPGLPSRPRQGLEGAAGAARPQSDRRDQRLPARRPAEAGRRPPRGEALRQLPRRPAQPPGPLQDRPAPRPRRRASAGR